MAIAAMIGCAAKLPAHSSSGKWRRAHVAGINALVRPFDAPYVPPNDRSVLSTTSNTTSAPLSRVLRGFVLLRWKGTLNPTSPPRIAAGTEELSMAEMKLADAKAAQPQAKEDDR